MGSRTGEVVEKGAVSREAGAKGKAGKAGEA